MMRLQKILFVLVFFSMNSIYAKDLTHRLGVGIKDNLSKSLPSLAVIYYPSIELAFTAGAGLDTKKDNSASQINAGVRRVIFFEPNLNFYIGGQAALVSYEDPASGKSNGYELQAIAGTEFFFQGLENLAFTLEMGAGIVSLDNVRFRTVGLDPFHAGVIFYF